MISGVAGWLSNLSINRQTPPGNFVPGNTPPSGLTPSLSAIPSICGTPSGASSDDGCGSLAIDRSAARSMRPSFMCRARAVPLRQSLIAALENSARSSTLSFDVTLSSTVPPPSASMRPMAGPNTRSCSSGASGKRLRHNRPAISRPSARKAMRWPTSCRAPACSTAADISDSCATTPISRPIPATPRWRGSSLSDFDHAAALVSSCQSAP